jgi:hypothetical protein
LIITNLYSLERAAMDNHASSHSAFLWVKTSAAAFAWIGGIALLLAFGRTTSPQDATAEMEQLVLRVERAQAIHPVTAQEMERLVRQSAYDCNQVDCSPELAARNSVARARLQMVIAQKTDAWFKIAGHEGHAVTGTSPVSR